MPPSPTKQTTRDNVTNVPTLVELCFIAIMERMEYNNEDLQRIPLNLVEKLISFMVARLHPTDMSVQTRPIKIRLVRQTRCITMRFSIYSHIDKVIHQVYERVVSEEKRDFFEKSLQRRLSTISNSSLLPNSDTTSSVDDEAAAIDEDSQRFVSSWGAIENYGLFQQAGQFRNACWLKLDRTLADYDIDPNETLEFKNTKSVLKIKFYGPWERVVHPLHQSTLLDETVKTFIVDGSKTVSEISQELARKLALRYPEELSLKRQTADEDVGTWLVSDLTLPEQATDPLHSLFFLKRQFCFAKDVIIDFSTDPEMLHFVFCQCFDAIIDGSHPCSLTESILFAALQCQICFGDHTRDFQESSVRLRDFLPSEYVNGHKNIARDITAQYAKLVGMAEQKAKLNYIQLAKSLKTYGYTFFHVTRSGSSDRFLFGISSETILILNPDTKVSINLYSLSTVKRWQVLNHVFSIDFVDRKEQYSTVESEAISYVLSSYIHHSLRNSPSIQKQWDQDYITVAKITSRRRLSSCSNNSVEDKKKYRTPGFISKKCPLYIEPKKMYINPLHTLNSDDSSLAKKELLYKDNKVSKVMRVLSDLSSKMIQSFSKTSTVQEREIVVKFSDKKVKSFVVDEQKTVAEITQEIGNRLGIKNTEDFSLQLQTNGSSHSMTSDDLGGQNATCWLRPYMPLAQQRVKADAKLLFKKKFHSFDTASDDCNNDPVYFNLLFFQSRDAIISNTYAASKEESIQLAATLFQINFGDHNPTIHRAGFLKSQDLKFFLPADCLELWGMSFQKIEKTLYKEHRNLRGIKEVYAKFRYVQLCRSLKTFGATFFTVKQRYRDLSTHNSLLPSNSTPLLLGFSRKCILIMIAKTRKLLLEFPLTHLRKWSYVKEQQTFSLDFGDYSQGIFLFHTAESEEISLYLSDYIDYLQTKIVGSQSFSKMILGESSA
eukprot:gene1346-1540_t